MKQKAKFIISHMISREGDGVIIKKRKDVLDESSGTYYPTFPETISTMAHVISLTGFRSTYYDIGREERSDYLLLFKGDEDINLKDRVIFGDVEVEIVQLVKRPPINPDYQEAICNEIKAR